MLPISRRLNRATPVSLSVSIRCPATVTVALFGRSRPAIRLSSVDFPLPDRPITGYGFAGGALRLTRFRRASRRRSLSLPR